MSAELTTLINLRDEAAVELSRVQKDLEKVRAKYVEAEIRHSTLAHAVSQLSSLAKETSEPETRGVTRKYQILRILRGSPNTSFTAKEIVNMMVDQGITFETSNPGATIHVAASSMAKAGLIHEGTDPQRGKVYWAPRQGQPETSIKQQTSPN